MVKQQLVKLINKYGNLLGGFALAITTIVSNSTCYCYLYQEELPKQAQKLRKF